MVLEIIHGNGGRELRGSTRVVTDIVPVRVLRAGDGADDAAAAKGSRGWDPIDSSV